jgi:nitroreductase
MTPSSSSSPLPTPTNRTADHPIDPLFLHRYSPRAFTGESIPEADLMTLFEAARWAPSNGNGQPWRFLYARRDTPAWETFFNLLTPGNQIWAHRAAVLVVVASRSVRDNGKPNRTHSFDAGAAWMSLALQARLMGVVAHGMDGYDKERAVRDLGLPADCLPDAMIAIGIYGKPEELAEEKRAQETPSQRKPLEEIVFEGGWKKSVEE